MTATYFLSDLHLDHKNICNFRTQFSSVEEHNAVIKENYHKVVRKNDTVWFLGDVAFSLEALEDLRTWNGIKHIVLGNHDPSSEPKRTGASLQDMLGVFSSFHGFTREYGYWLSHCPIRSEELRGRMGIHGHCVDLQTEILTNNGWKFRKDLSGEDLVYSYDVSSNSLELKPILEIIDINYTGTVYNFRTKSVEQRVTSDHTMVGLTGKYKKYTEILAKDLAQKHSFIFILNSIHANKGVLLSDKMLELYIAIAADGSITPANLVRFILHKERKKTYVKNLLEALCIDYKVYDHPTSSRSSINFRLPEELLNWKIKGLDTKLIDCTPDQFQIILKAYANTDGTQYSNYSTVYSSKKEEYDLLGHLATINGYTSTTTIRQQHGFSKGISYEMFFRKASLSTSHRVKKQLVQEEVSNEHFWCIRTEFQNFFSRRNGKTSLTGNCHSNLIDDPRYLNVCMEHIDYTPISLEQIRTEFDRRKPLIDAITESEKYKNGIYY